jgi:predicted Zn-dependent protease
MYVEVTRLWWDRFAASNDWKAAAALGRECARKRPHLAYGWENWAWALHKLGRTQEARGILAPILKKLKLDGPPSGRAAYCLACFCGALGKKREGSRWLRLALALAADKEVFKDHAVHDPDLREIWPGMPQFSDVALSL